MLMAAAGSALPALAVDNPDAATRFWSALAEPGTVLQIDIRGRERDAEVVPLPFYKKES